MLGQRCSTVCDAGPTLIQQLVNIACLLDEVVESVGPTSGRRLSNYEITEAVQEIPDINQHWGYVLFLYRRSVNRQSRRRAINGTSPGLPGRLKHAIQAASGVRRDLGGTRRRNVLKTRYSIPDLYMPDKSGACVLEQCWFTCGPMCAMATQYSTICSSDYQASALN